MNPDLCLSDDAAFQLAQVALSIAAARARAVRGAAVDLEPLEQMVAGLCATIRFRAQVADAALVRRLNSVRSELAALADDLTEAFESARGRSPILRSGTEG